MARRRDRRTIQRIAYILTAIVALSMIISLVGPVLIHEPGQATPTLPPTWTPFPRSTATPTSQSAATPTSQPTATLIPSPTLTPQPTATPTPSPTPTIQPTQTPTVQVSRLVFAVCGDSQGNPQLYGRLLDRVVQDGDAFLIDTGDMVSVSTQKNWSAFQQLMAGFPLPFYPAPGNHDVDSDDSLDNFVRYSGAPAEEYSFDVGTVHFVVANSALGVLHKKQLAWIDEDLSASDQPVKMVILHYPPFDPDGSNYILGGGREGFMSLMQKDHVAYVFAGHIHAYSRAVRDGTTYIVTGGAGAELYTQGHPNAFHHYVRVTVEGTQVSTEVVHID